MQRKMRRLEIEMKRKNLLCVMTMCFCAKKILISSVTVMLKIVGDEKIQSYIKSKQLGKAIRDIDQSENRMKALEAALRNEEFRDFADHCLQTLQLLDKDGQFAPEDK
eukprot:TRINITY_DN8499_c0_g2_i1.p1 TRINITY_DN8499_c0_g2~~TRINITY_DN8499_c0_g2_i1.p1  ORF type:complete len:108 (+),score=11.87 TRINITY_DN8499_c0_g2_i1:197-520(+)